MKNKLLMLVALVFVLVGCGVSAEEYGNDLEKVADDMLENSAEVEGVLNEYSKVWSYSIENRSPIPPEQAANDLGIDEDVILEHFEINTAGNVPNDFSTNIYSMVSYYEDLGKLDDIEKKSNEIQERISELSSPSEEFESAYGEVLDMYDLSKRYINMANNPSGSLQEFNSNKNELSNDIISKYNRLEVVIPSVE